MTTPYITPEVFRNFPTGLDLSTVPFPGATEAQQAAEIVRVCFRATADVIRICEQELRATISTDTEQAPGWRVMINNQGIAEFRMDRWPILQILGGQYSPAGAFPRIYTQIPASAMATKYGVPGELGTIAPDAAAIGPDTILIAPGFLTWRGGRGAYTVQVQYINGWPHCGMDVNAVHGATQIHVDDVTGWLGVQGSIVDGADTETIQVINAAVDFLANATPAFHGPGMLTLAMPLIFDHTIDTASGDTVILVTSMPDDIQTAACYCAIEQILLRGTTAVTPPPLPGAETHVGRDAGDLLQAATERLQPYKRTAF